MKSLTLKNSITKSSSQSFFLEELNERKSFVYLKKRKKKKKFFKRRRNYIKFLKRKRKKLETRLSKKKYGILRISNNKRNIFCTLSNSRGKILSTISSGLLKVKGRKRQALHIVKATGQLIIKQILKKKITKLILFHKGKGYRKKKKTLLKTFAIVKKLNFLKINRPSPKSHNGCRPKKIRRK